MFSAIFLAENTLTAYIIYRTGIFLSRQDSNTQEMSPETFQFFSMCPFSRHHAQIQILLASPLSSSSTATNTTLCELCKSHQDNLPNSTSFLSNCWVPPASCLFAIRWIPAWAIWKFRGVMSWGWAFEEWQIGAGRQILPPFSLTWPSHTTLRHSVRHFPEAGPWVEAFLCT